MKVFPFVLCALLISISSCSDVENTVEDLRDKSEIEEQEIVTDVTTPEETETVPVETTTENQSEWSYKVVPISENNWGYQLFQKGTMLINQTSIPSVQGVDGFDSEEKAERTAKHILNKLEKGIFPPTVDKEELDSLGVLRD